MDELELGVDDEVEAGGGGSWSPDPRETPDTGDGEAVLYEEPVPAPTTDSGDDCAKLQGTGCAGLGGVSDEECVSVELELEDEADSGAWVEGGGCSCGLSASPGWLALIGVVALLRRLG